MNELELRDWDKVQAIAEAEAKKGNRCTEVVGHTPADKCLSCTAGDPCNAGADNMTPVETSNSMSENLE